MLLETKELCSLETKDEIIWNAINKKINSEYSI